MADFIFLMHNDVKRETNPADWENYIAGLCAGKHFAGGSAMGEGVLVGETESDAITKHIGGYIIVNAENLDEAKRLVKDNPVRKAGGTVEVRSLPQT